METNPRPIHSIPHGHPPRTQDAVFLQGRDGRWPCVRSWAHAHAMPRVAPVTHPPTAPVPATRPRTLAKANYSWRPWPSPPESEGSRFEARCEGSSCWFRRSGLPSLQPLAARHRLTPTPDSWWLFFVVPSKGLCSFLNFALLPLQLPPPHTHPAAAPATMVDTTYSPHAF